MRKGSRKYLLYLTALLVLAWGLSLSPPAGATQPPAGEEALFTSSVAPDALIVLDLSGSMDWNPAGKSETYGASNCAANTTYCSGTGCSDGFCSSSKTNCATNCSRLAIAKRSLFSLLDDNNDNTINSADEGSLNVRIGYMRFYNCSSDDTGNDYNSGCISLKRAIGSKYSLIYCASNTSCTITSGSSSSNCINGESASGGTPLASALREAKTYLDAHKAADSAAACRKKFVILVTDGADTFACSGSGLECQEHMYKRRRDAVARAKALADAGYKVFVVGFGAAMPDYLENTLNWMAYYGGTDNPNAPNSGSTSAVTPPAAGTCATDTDVASATCYDYSGSHTPSKFKANSNDPGYASLSGYAFLAADADQLAESLKTAMNIIRQANYAFSQASVQSSRTADENYIYEGSFTPDDSDSFWKGYLKKYAINSDGSVASSPSADGGQALQNTSAKVRNIKTYKGGNLVHFTRCAPLVASCTTYPHCDDFSNALITATCVYNITPADLGITSGTDSEKNTYRNNVVGYIRGDPAYNPETTGAGTNPWKLGDVFRSTPITVGTPSVFYEDMRDTSSYSVSCTEGDSCGQTTTREVNAFGYHRCTHCRASANLKRLIVAGANDGQLHAFRTADMNEVWSFIPPNLLTKLKNMTHTSHPTSQSHQYFVDGPVTVADVWLGSGTGTGKDAGSWKTLLVFGLGRGGTSYSWSSSAYCDAGINATYSSTYQYYCGYHALDLSDELNPTYLWHLNFTSAANRDAQAPYLGDPWSKMMPGRVRIKEGGQEVEKWVGFVGGGYNAADCAGGGSCELRGKGFYVVDLANGNILWSYNRGNDTTMDYSIAAPPAIVDTDNDGFIDTVYIGDLGGSMWRFKFCLSSEMPDCGIPGSGAGTVWSGGRFYRASSGNIRPIFTSAAVSKDSSGNLWVYWGTGDKTDPTAANAQERFFGVKDNDRSSTYTFSDMDNLTSANQTYNPARGVGWALNLAGGGEKVLADPTVFGGVVYFTTYVPAAGNNPCEQGGDAYLYALKYTTGGGALSSGERRMGVGSGIPSAPVLSLGPGSGGTPDLYVTTSGGGGVSASTQRVNITPPGVANRTNMIYWKDRRIQ